MKLPRRNAAGTPTSGQFAMSAHQPADMSSVDLGGTPAITKKTLAAARLDLRVAEEQINEQKPSSDPYGPSEVIRRMNSSQLHAGRDRAAERYRQMLRNTPPELRGEYVKDLADRRKSALREVAHMNRVRAANPSAGAIVDRLRTKALSDLGAIDAEIAAECKREALVNSIMGKPEEFRSDLAKLAPDAAWEAQRAAALTA